MTYSVVDPNSVEIEHLASVDVKFSGAHIGGGIYVSANHFPTPGGGSNATPQRSLDGESERHSTLEIDYTLPDGGEPWDDYRDGLISNGTTTAVRAGFDMSLQIGSRFGPTETFYGGPSVPLLIAADPAELEGGLTITGYPDAPFSLSGTGGVLHQSTTTLTAGSYIEEDVNGDIGGYFQTLGAQIEGGMSGGGNFLDFDADGDGVLETYLIGTTSRVAFIDNPGPDDTWLVQSTAFTPHYHELAMEIEGLTGADARSADLFARNVLLSGQTLGSSKTSVEGTFFNEDIYGGVNADQLSGGGGNDLIEGRGGDDLINAGDGTDTLEGGAGNDTLAGGAGADFFRGESFGGGDTDTLTDFSVSDGDVVDLSDFFVNYDAVIAASSELADGSVEITLPASSGGGVIKLLNTSTSELTARSLNVVCFLAGTLITSAKGPQKVEDLQEGDLICGPDQRLIPLREKVSRHIGARELAARPNLAPIEFGVGAFGEQIPEKPLFVSPQHRILVNSNIARRMLSGPCLVSAKKLEPIAEPKREWPDGCHYVHLVFDSHELVLANGCWSESLLPAQQALNAVPTHKRQSIAQSRSVPAVPILEGKRAHRLVARHLKNKKAIQPNSHDLTVNLPKRKSAH